MHGTRVPDKTTLHLSARRFQYVRSLTERPVATHRVNNMTSESTADTTFLGNGRLACVRAVGTADELNFSGGATLQCGHCPFQVEATPSVKAYARSRVGCDMPPRPGMFVAAHTPYLWTSCQ